MSTASSYYIPFEQIFDEDFINEIEDYSYETEENLDIINKFIIEHLLSDTYKKGDIIDLIEESRRYRNDGKLIWNGNKAIFLESNPNIDEYGHVPTNFIVSDGEFNPTYWTQSICHNNCYFPCKSYREQVVNSLSFDSEFTDEEYWHGKYNCNGVTHHLFFIDNGPKGMVYCSCDGGYYIINGVKVKDFPKQCKEEIIERIMDMNVPFQLDEYNGNVDLVKDSNLMSNVISII